MADTSTRNFSVLNLCQPEKQLPTAIPLILQSNYQWNPVENSVTKLECHDSPIHLKINEEALALLKAIRKPVAVLAVCGPARTGKSYFISRMVNKPGSFKVGHSMEACTRGIWLSTVALECDEFVLLLLDTEGIGMVGERGSNPIVTKILVNTVLVSSLLVYNSMEVPTRNDLQQMSFLAHLSSSISIKGETECRNPKELQKYFPQLMWLFRDVVKFPNNKITDDKEDDEEESSEDEESDEEEEDKEEEERYECLQKYVNTKVLVKTSGMDNNTDNVVETIRTLFPQPLLCQWLPPPSANSEDLQNIENNDNLDEMFVKRINKVICHLKNVIRPKIGFDMKTYITGESMAALMQKYADALNKDGSVLNLQESWLAAIELAISHKTRSLKEEYEVEMESRTMGKLPMEVIQKETDEASITLFGLHHEILSKKREALSEYLSELLADIPAKDELIDKTESSFESDIVVNEGERVTGGLLLMFIIANYQVSENQCKEVWSGLVQKKNIHERFKMAMKDSDANLSKEVCEDIEKIKEEYNEKAVGPARECVKKDIESLNETKNTLQSIPGPPIDFKVVGKSTNSLKLSWKHPKVHADAAKKYVVKMKDGKSWKDLATTENNWYIVKELKKNTTYEFRVASWNDEQANMKGEIEESIKTGTRLGPLARATLCTIGFTGGTAAAPILTYVAIPTLAGKVEKTKKQKVLLAAFVATSPLIATLGAPVIGATVAYRTFKETGDWGDMEEGETHDVYATSKC